MIEKFDAFISYKHAPLDNKVAEQIQQGLERFHIPAEIRKKTGRTKIERIFRDKAELPITSSLDNNISYALEHSDFLIVICSHSTKLSGWVPREIEYFLKFHPMSHVLTVLAEGEPSEVIPAQLLGTTVLKTDDDGNILTDDEGNPVTEEIPLEPLSCDYRLPYRQAKKEELPRLAAAILGCSYDELIRRARQYRMRRLTIASSIAGAMASVAIGYLIWSNAQIRKNYEIAQENLRQAQINQSVYLANASSKILEQEHDGVGAVQLALAAVLGPEGVAVEDAVATAEDASAADLAESVEDAAELAAAASDPASAVLSAAEDAARPITPESIYALSEAIQAYHPVSDYRYPTKKYSMSSPVTDMMVDDDKQILYLLDESGELGIFDIASQERLYARSFEDAFAERMSVLPVNADEVLVCDGFVLYKINWKTDETLWELPLWVDKSGSAFEVHGADFQQNYLYTSQGYLWRDLYPNVAMALSPDKTVLALDAANDEIRLIDMQSGQETGRFAAGCETGADVGYYENLIGMILWSPDGKTVAAVMRQGSLYTYTVTVAAFETDTGAVHRFDTDEIYWEDMAFAGNDRLLLLTSGSILDNDVSYMTETASGKDAMIYECESQAFCLSLTDDSVMWQTALPWNQPWEMRGRCDYASKEDLGREAAIFTISNKGYLLNMTDGSLIASQDYTGAIMKIESIAESDVLLILANSNLAFLSLPAGEPGHYEMPAFLDTGTPMALDWAIRVPDKSGGIIFLCEQEKCRDVIGFSSCRDEDGTRLDKGFEDYPKAQWISGSRLFVMTDDDLTGLSLESGEVLFEKSLENAEMLLRVEPGEMGTAEERFGMVMTTGDGYECWLIDPDTGETEVIPLECRMKAARSGYLYGIENGNEDSFGTVVKFSLADKSYERITVKGGSGDWLVDDRGFFVSPDGTQAALATNNNNLCRVDLKTGICEPYKEEAANANYFLWSEDGLYYATISNAEISIYTADGESISRIPTGGRYYCFAHFEGDYLYVAYGSAKLFRYRVSDGSEEGVADFALYLNDKDDGTFAFSDGYLYLKAGKNVGRISTIDLQEMKRVNLIDECIGYSLDTNAYVVRRKVDGEYQYFMYPHYSVEELVRKGRDFVGGNVMPMEMRARYGLN